MKSILLTLITVLVCFVSVIAQQPSMSTDEFNVPEYVVTDVLSGFNGDKIKTVKQWEKRRRPEILKFFRDQVYGKVPGKLKISDINVYEEHGVAMNGKAIRQQVDLLFKRKNKTLKIEVLIYLPVSEKKVPVFLGYNFFGNQSLCHDPNVRLTESWIRNNNSFGITNNKITEQLRGAHDYRYPLDKIIESGYGIVTAFYGDVVPDNEKGAFNSCVLPFFYKKGQNHPKADEWGAISAWAWGLSKIMDYIESNQKIDSKKVIVWGHSRLGKTALWAAANDKRFAMCISNDSGCMGASLSRRHFGENIAVINYSFPWWFDDNFKKYNEKESSLPVDQHMLLATIAPRPLYVASAEKDLRADPKGEFLSAKLASSVYQLYGLNGIYVSKMPKIDYPVFGVGVGYHIRSGGHNVTSFDWTQYILFADKLLMKKE